MAFLQQLFIVLHVITAAAWFGMGLRLAAQARTVVGLERSAALALADDTARTVRFMSIFVVMTLVFSYAAFFLGGGFSGYSGRYHFHAAVLLIVLLVVVQYGLVQPAWTRLQGAVAGGGNAEGLQKRVAMGVGIGHLLWLVLLVIMFWERLVATL